MNNNFENILNNDENDNHERLNDLNDALNKDDFVLEEMHGDFDREAAEGLKQIANNKIPSLVNQINGNLKLQLKNKKRIKKKIPEQSSAIITIITLLIIVVLAYIIIKKFYQ